MKKDKIISKKIFVGVSGGVDSSVSLALLKDAGHDVTGVFIKTWQPDFIDCSMLDERRDAIRVCAHLGVPFLECDAEKAYKKEVADYLVSEYKKGRTPNPDILCNREIKFGVFWNFAKAHGAEAIATGHYAENRFHISDFRLGVIKSKNKSVNPNYYSLITNHSEKDQTYFLWKLTQDDLAHTLFPVGHLTKDEVRALAKKFHLPTAEKKDSQGVCMLGDLDMKDYLGHYIKEEVGKVVTLSGVVVGEHRGVRFYTVGERHGFTITKNYPDQKPLYIVARDILKNELVVDDNQGDYWKRIITVTFSDVNTIGKSFQENDDFLVRFRHRGALLKGRIISVESQKIKVLFYGLDKGVDIGQSGVFYKNLEKSEVYREYLCLGGGIIQNVD